MLVCKYGCNQIYVRSASLSRLQLYPMCDDCEVRSKCTERVCSLRIYPSGRMAICLHGPPGTACVDSVEDPDKGIHRILNSLGIES